MTKETIDILIVDDEAAGRGVLKKLLQEMLSVPHHILEANSVTNALKVISESKIDILFLDIQMPEQNGFELLKQTPIIDFEIIFVTGFDRYAVHAFKFNALDYLLKPVEVDELRNAIDKALFKIKSKFTSKENYNALLSSLPEKSMEKKVAVHIKEKVVLIEVSSICTITAINNYSEIITYDNKKYITPRLLREFEIYFEHIPSFVRINRSSIVNVAYIKTYSKDNPCFIEMKNGTEFEISRRKKTEILKTLDSL